MDKTIIFVEVILIKAYKSFVLSLMRQLFGEVCQGNGFMEANGQWVFGKRPMRILDRTVKLSHQGLLSSRVCPVRFYPSNLGITYLERVIRIPRLQLSNKRHFNTSFS